MAAAGMMRVKEENNETGERTEGERKEGGRGSDEKNGGTTIHKEKERMVEEEISDFMKRSRGHSYDFVWWCPVSRTMEQAGGSCVRKLLGHTGGVYSVAYSNDNKYIVSGSWDNSVRIWSVENGEERMKLEGHTDYVMSVGFSHDNKYIVSGSEDNSVRIWSVENGEEMMTLEGHTDEVTSVGFSNDNKYIVSKSDDLLSDNTQRVWNVSNGTCLYNGPDDQPLPKEYASLFTSSTIDLSSLSSNGSTVGIETGTTATISPSGSAACSTENAVVHIFVKQ
jgi:WD40 repeat protein